MNNRAMAGGPQRPVPPPGGWVVFYVMVMLLAYVALGLLAYALVISA